MTITVSYTFASDNTEVFVAPATRTFTTEQWNTVLDILRPTRAGFVSALETYEDTDLGAYHCDPIPVDLFNEVADVLEAGEVTKFPAQVNYVIQIWVDE